MRRGIVLGLIVAVGAASVSLAGYQQRGAGAGEKPRVIEPEKLHENFYVLRGAGGGGNTAVFIQANGVTVVDTKNPGWGAPILAAIKQITPKPVTTIINTHTHGDHVSGNVEFPATVDVVVHANTAENMKEMRGVAAVPTPATGPSIFAQNKGVGMAKRTFTDTMTVGSGNDQINLYYFGRGHTNGDAWVLFPTLRIVHAGDIFSGKNVPLLDANNGGSGAAIADTLAKAHTTLLKSADTIITGHSTQMTMADLLQYSNYNRDFLNHVRAGKKAGQSVEAIAKSWTNPASYTGYAEPAAARLQANVQVVYNEIP